MYESNDFVKQENSIVNPLFIGSKRLYLIIGFLVIVVGLGAIAWLLQLLNGLGVTGLNDRVFWGMYVTNFIFFIGISYSGTLISATWRV